MSAPAVVMNPRMSSSLCEGQSSGGGLSDDWLFISPDSATPEFSEVSRNEQEEEEDRGKLRSKLVSAWNSVKYGEFEPGGGGSGGAPLTQ